MQDDGSGAREGGKRVGDNEGEGNALADGPAAGQAGGLPKQ